MEATLSLPIISTYHVLKLTSFVDRLYANLLGWWLEQRWSNLTSFEFNIPCERIHQKQRKVTQSQSEVSF